MKRNIPYFNLMTERKKNFVEGVWAANGDCLGYCEGFPCVYALFVMVGI